ncbi:MAG: G5 domain-containing protein [Anaerolineales bacterium]|nr:G5 domain-containing protein [Anaerolineales bacterium]MDW8447150.1 G5 domain-containing protein [Anaerolineales bacterium]
MSGSALRMIIPLRNLAVGVALLSLSGALIGGCATAAEGRAQNVKVEIAVDGEVISIEVSPSSTVGQAIQQAKISIGQLDRVEPPMSSVIESPLSIRVIRVQEKFEVERVILPFEKKVVRTESLPEQVTLLAQKGQNGEAEITYRILYEDGVEVSRTVVNEPTVLKEPVAEIVMIGIQKPFTTYEIPGRIAYLLGGNAWVIEGNTANRILVVSSGDLDGRVFRLSRDGQWLLFTRREKEEGKINSLWAASLTDLEKPAKMIDLKVANVVHFADWYALPGALRVFFSTVEPRPTAPGWQANNDLISLDFSPNGWVSKWRTLVDTNSGGIYGWWGTTFALEPGGERIGFARPDGVGLVNEGGGFEVLLDLVPYQTGADWAWVPGIAWSPDGQFLYTVNHVGEGGLSSPEGSRSFAVTAISLSTGQPIPLVQQAGMFAYPVPSPLLETGQARRYRIAYLQAILPEQSDVSRYRLMVIDQDGSNRLAVFPAEAESGLEPQIVSWSPSPMEDTGLYALAVIYQGNLYLVDVPEGETEEGRVRQITGDGLVSRVAWSPNQAR